MSGRRRQRQQGSKSYRALYATARTSIFILHEMHVLSKMIQLTLGKGHLGWDAEIRLHRLRATSEDFPINQVRHCISLDQGRD